MAFMHIVMSWCQGHGTTQTTFVKKTLKFNHSLFFSIYRYVLLLLRKIKSTAADKYRGGGGIRVAIRHGHVRKISFKSWKFLEILGEEILTTWPMSRMSMNFVASQGKMRAFCLDYEPCRNTVSIKTFPCLRLNFKTKSTFCE